MLLVAIKTRPQTTISHVPVFAVLDFTASVALFYAIRCVKQQKFLILSSIFFSWLFIDTGNFKNYY